MLKKRVLCAALCVLLCLPAGCRKPSEPPTLTPTLENAYIVIKQVSVSADGTVHKDSTSIQNLYDPVTQTLPDYREDPITFSVKSLDPDHQSVDIAIDKPLMYDGAAVSEVTVSRDQNVVLTADGENGAKDTFTLTMDSHDSRPVWGYLFGSHLNSVDMTMCYDAGTLLTLYPCDAADDHVFTMSFADDPDALVRGTYTLGEDTLTLYEDRGLSVTTLRRDARRGGWRVDGNASARHTLARMPSLEHGRVLTFGFSCTQQYEDSRYGYRITDMDGNTLLAEQKLEDPIEITPLSPTMLCIESNRSTRYLNTVTGECSASYNGVLAASATHTVYVKHDLLIVEELGGDYARLSHDITALGFKGISQAVLEGDRLTLLGRDNQDTLRVICLNPRTGDLLPTCPLTISETEALKSYDPHILSKSGDSFLSPITISFVCRLFDDATVFYSGINDAVMLLDGKWTDIPAAMRRYESFPGDVDVYKETLTAAGLETQLKADVAAGLATVTHPLDGTATLYRYENRSTHHAVLFADNEGRREIYIGDADAALTYLSGELKNNNPCIKIHTFTT